MVGKLKNDLPLSVPKVFESRAQVLLGQNTSGNEQNHLILASVENLKEVDEKVNADRALSFNILKFINHPGAVNRCAYSPQARHRGIQSAIYRISLWQPFLCDT